MSDAHPFEIHYRYRHNTLEAWKTVDVRNKRQGRPTDIGQVHLERNISSLIIFIFAFNDCCLHKDGFLKVPPLEDPPTTEIEETTRTGAVGGAEPGESGQERRLFPLRGARLP